MIKKLRYLAYLAGLVCLVSCGGGEQVNTQSVATTFTNETRDSIYSLSTFTVSDSVTVKGTNYTYSYSFRPDTSLAIVSGSYGYKYYDNILDLTIYKDGEEFYTHRFTKNSFSDHVSDKLKKHYALIGFNFNYVRRDDHSRFHFIATVGDPDESGDSSATFAVDISTDGSITLSEMSDVGDGPDFGE